LKVNAAILIAVLVAATAGGVFAVPKPGTPRGSHSASSSSSANSNETDLRIAGEQAFHTNCNRCHMAPHKFPPRMMATIVRHMRVRATLTDQDMRLILRYMTQ